MSGITTHVLDTAAGTPAIGMMVALDVHQGSEWIRLADGHTDNHGRLMSLTDNIAIGLGVYRLTFDTGTYHRDVNSFFPEVQVTFAVADASGHYHVPLVISPFGYSTYRGT